MTEIDERAQDHPLRGSPTRILHPGMYLSEFMGTALLVFIGLSIVIALWSPASPLYALPLSLTWRRIVTGLLFGGTGATIAYSRVGKVSGAHINPAVTIAFWLENKIKAPDALCYIAVQLAGGLLGAAALLAWAGIGFADHFGASLPEAGKPIWLPLAGEIVCGFLLVALIFIMASHKATQKFTPLINPPLFAFLNVFESSLSGASANPARSLGPAAIADMWQGQWIYFVGPCLGGALAVGVLRLKLIGSHCPAEARLFHFHHRPHDAVLNLEGRLGRVDR